MVPTVLLQEQTRCPSMLRDSLQVTSDPPQCFVCPLPGGTSHQQRTRGEQTSWDTRVGCRQGVGLKEGSSHLQVGTDIRSRDLHSPCPYGQSPQQAQTVREREGDLSFPSPSGPSRETSKPIALLMLGAGSCPHMGTSPNSRCAAHTPFHAVEKLREVQQETPRRSRRNE